MQTTTLDSLNPQQQEAVRHFQGPALIIAGPGTGKTRVLTERIRYLIEHHKIPASQIQAITFTNKAADEIKARLNKLLPAQGAHIAAGTFHGFGYTFLKRHHAQLQRTHNFSLFDDADRKELLRYTLNIPQKQLKTVCEAISSCKQNRSPLASFDEEMQNLFANYGKFLQKFNAFDLDDLICKPVQLMRTAPDIAKKEGQQYQWLLVDEYQDINRIQYDLITTLMPELNSNLCVIGDPDQAIYGFRGSNVSFIRQFRQTYSEAKQYELQTSYRCSDRILSASRGIVQAPQQQPRLLTGLEPGVKIRISEQATDKSEAEFISRRIEQMIGGVGFFSIDSNITQGEADPDASSFSDFAILCRIKSQIKVIEKALLDHNIPHQLISDAPLSGTKLLQPIIDLLRLSLNPQNSLLKERLIRKKICGPSEIPELVSDLAENPLADCLPRLIDRLHIEPAADQAQIYAHLLSLSGQSDNSRKLFLQKLILGSGVDTYLPEAEKVTVMTMHAAKGLEFPCVFVAGCEQGLIPYSLFPEQISDEPEERRLLYVAMTRAKKLLYLSWAQKRYLFGREYRLGRSPFIAQIEEELLEKIATEKPRKKKKDNRQMELF